MRLIDGRRIATVRCMAHPGERPFRRRSALPAIAAMLALAVACSAVGGTAVPATNIPAGVSSTPADSTVANSTAVDSTAVDSTAADRTTADRTTADRTTEAGTAAGVEPSSPADRARSSSTAPSTTAAGHESSEPSVAPDPAPAGVGAAGIGDDYYPASGNGGYDVAGYQVALVYRPESNALTATTTVTATVTSAEGLRRFNFDLQPTMKVSAVTINQVAAGFTHSDAELVVTPAAPLPSGSVFTAVVTYAGAPTSVSGGTAGLGDGGWYRTQSGGALVAGEPLSASAWYPVNEHPSDPATFAVTATVPHKWKVISNGVEQTTGLPAAPAGMEAFRWVQGVPIASYLTTLFIDTFTVKTGKLDDGTPVVSAIAPGDTEDAALHDMTPRVIDVLSKYFGKYPFKAVGGIYSNENIPFALETATRPVYADWVDLDTVVHELAHQWYGDDVMVHRWADVCLNECFASYAPWLWHADIDKADLDAQWHVQMQEAVTDPSFWRSPLVDMGAGHEFTAVYQRGPLALHALRHQMGDAKFLALLKKWPATYSGKNASFDDLESMASELAGQDLRPFFQVWFRGTRPPARSDYPAGLR